MVETMIDANGAGLAAPQVHVPLRVVVFQAPDERSDPGLSEDETFRSHRAADRADQSGDRGCWMTSAEGGWEGCLSVPGLRGFVERPAISAIAASISDGKMIARTAKGFHARVVQHECDHLDGMLYPQPHGRSVKADLRKRSAAIG